VHYGGNVLPWKEVDRFAAGQVRLLDASGKVSDLDSNQADVVLSMVSPAEIRTSSEGTTKVKITCQWESSAHHSVLLDRPQLDKNRVQLTLKWQVESPRVTHPLKFNFDFSVQTRPRTWFRQASLLGQLFYNQRVVRSTASNYCVTLKPSSAKRVGDLWRMDTTGEYISGQEMLSSWAPRGVSLIRDFMQLQKQQRRTAEIESARGYLSLGALSPPVRPTEIDDRPLDEKHTALLQKYIDLWQTSPSAGEIMLLQASDADSPRRRRSPRPSDQSTSSSKTSTAGDEDTQIPLAASVERHLKSPTLLKAGWLLCPDAAGKHWIRTYVELRRPYLHLFSKDGDEVNAINLTNSRIDADPQIASLLQRPNLRMEVWAVYAVNRAWLFACRNDSERGEWIWAVDRSYVERSVGGSGEGSEGEEGEW
jgi:kinesin family protein 1